jgi:hypothetical protein
VEYVRVRRTLSERGRPARSVAARPHTGRRDRTRSAGPRRAAVEHFSLVKEQTSLESARVNRRREEQQLGNSENSRERRVVQTSAKQATLRQSARCSRSRRRRRYTTDRGCRNMLAVPVIDDVPPLLQWIKRPRIFYGPKGADTINRPASRRGRTFFTCQRADEP